jgi:hypothetical protein
MALTERLTAFEFLAATDEPQIVRLTAQGLVLVEFVVVTWFGYRPAKGGAIFAFERRDELIIEGQGLGRPYWNDDAPPWTVLFDPKAERERITAIRRAVRRELNRASLTVM